MKDLKGATAYACVDRMGHKAESRVAECAMDSDSGALVGLINFDATGFRLGFAGLQGVLEPWHDICCRENATEGRCGDL